MGEDNAVPLWETKLATYWKHWCIHNQETGGSAKVALFESTINQLPIGCVHSTGWLRSERK